MDLSKAYYEKLDKETRKSEMEKQKRLV